MDELVHPNLHVAVVHFPIALLVTGVAGEVIGGLLGARGLRGAGRWMLLLGAMAGLPVSVSGLYALQDVARAGFGGDAGAYLPWREVVEGAKFTDAQSAALTLHAQIQIAVTAAALAVCAIYIACSEAGRRVLYWPLLAVMLGTVAATMAGAHVGGESVYRHGTGVQRAAENAALDEGRTGSRRVVELADVSDTPPTTEPADTQPHPETPGTRPIATAPASPATTRSTGLASGLADLDLEAALRRVAPPLQVHGLLGGGAIALGVIALACALGNASALRTRSVVPRAAGPKTVRGIPVGDEPAKIASPPMMPASRLLLLTAVVVAAAAVAGLWQLSVASGTRVPQELWETIAPFPPKDALSPDHREELRRLVHTVLGGTMLVLPMVLAGWTRLRPGGRLVLTVLGLAWLLAALAQLGVGSLLMFDTPAGPLWRLGT